MDNYQVGVFPITEDGKIVLVTSRGRGKWIFPKGKREQGRSDRAVAREEAYEEAGLLGVMKTEFEEFTTRRKGGEKLRMFQMRVKELIKSFPEIDQRQRAVVTIKEAENLLTDDLCRVLHRMTKKR